MLEEKLSRFYFDDKTSNTIEEMKTSLAAFFDKTAIEKELKEFENRLEDIINNQNYEKLLRICCLEHGEILKGVCNSILNNYEGIPLTSLKNNKEICKMIINLNFATLDEWLSNPEKINKVDS